MIIAMLLAAQGLTGCAAAKSTIAQDECALAESMRIPANCQDPQTQADMNICSYRDDLRADITLNKTWAQVTAKLKPDEKAGQDGVFSRLLAGQRAWLIYRDKHCSLWAKYYEGGTIAALSINHCRIDITNFRIAELKRLLEEG